MKTAKSPARGDHVMEQLHTAKRSFFGSWRCAACVGGDYVTPVPPSQSKKKIPKDQSFDLDSVKTKKKVPGKHDLNDPNFELEFVKSSQTAPEREEKKDPSLTKDSLSASVKKDRKDRSLRALLNNGDVPKPREDHLLLESQALLLQEDDAGDVKANRKDKSQAKPAKAFFNEPHPLPTPPDSGNKPKAQDTNAKNLEGTAAIAPAPIDVYKTESLKHSEPVTSTPSQAEAPHKEIQEQEKQSQQVQVSEEVQTKTGLEKPESLDQVEQVRTSAVLGEVAGKDNNLNGELPPTSQADGHKLRDSGENETDSKAEGVPSQISLPGKLSVEHQEPDSEATISSEAAPEGDINAIIAVIRSLEMGDKSTVEGAQKQDSQQTKPLEVDSVEKIPSSHDSAAAQVGGKAAVQHGLDSPPPEFIKQFSEDPRGEKGGNSISKLINHFERTASQKIESPKDLSKTDPNKLSRRASRSLGEQWESVHNQESNSTQSSILAGQKKDIPHIDIRSIRQEIEGKKAEDGLQKKQTENADQSSESTGLLPLNLEDLHQGKASKAANAAHEKGEMQDGSEKQVQGGAEDPEECFPNTESLERYLSMNSRGGSISLSSPHDKGHEGDSSLWDRVYSHDFGEDKHGRLYKEHSHHMVGHSQHAGHSHHAGNSPTEIAENGEPVTPKDGWKLGFISVPHVVVVGALTALSVIGKAAN